MKRLAIGATLLCGTLSLPARAQEPVAGARFHIQLVAGDTGVAPAERDPRLLTGQTSTVHAECVRPDPGEPHRNTSPCGLRVALRVLVDTTVTTDAQGHFSQRLTWAGGDAVAELDASDGSSDKLRLKVAFWPRLAHGGAAPPATALRMTNAAATYGRLVAMTVYDKDGVQALLVRPER